MTLDSLVSFSPIKNLDTIPTEQLEALERHYLAIILAQMPSEINLKRNLTEVRRELSKR